MIRIKSFLQRLFKFRSIQSSIAIAFSCLIVLTTLVFAVMSYRFSSTAIEKNSMDNTYQLIEQVNTNIEHYITTMETVSSSVLRNRDIQSFLSIPSSEVKVKESEYHPPIIDFFDTLLSGRKDITSILILGYNGGVVIDKEGQRLNLHTDIKKLKWYEAAKNADGKAVISSSHVQNVLKGKYQWVISLSRELNSADGQKHLGILLVDLNYSVINDLCSKIKLGKSGYIFIIDNNGSIVYHPQQQLIYSKLKTERIEEVLATKEKCFITGSGSDRKIYTVKSSAYTGWKIVGVAYLEELVSNKKEMQAFYLMVGGICFTLAIGMSVFISSRISRPIKLLETSMIEVEKGNFDIQVGIDNSNEIGELSRAFNIMTSKIKELMFQIVKEQEQKRKSELKALQAQINPHFLYNTLDSIIWMSERKKSEEAVQMTSALAKLFRLSISKGEDIVPISDEIEHIKNYLTIQKIRYKSKLDFEIFVENEVLSYKTLKILLQPLVENSIYHGIKSMPEIGLIRITGQRIDNKILMQVSDNGVGMSPEEMKTILIKQSKGSKVNGVGVINVNERIKLYFGEAYGLEYISEAGKGTTVNIWLPVVE